MKHRKRPSTDKQGGGIPTATDTHVYTHLPHKLSISSMIDMI